MLRDKATVQDTKNSKLAKFVGLEGEDSLVSFIAWGGLADKAAGFKPGDHLEIVFQVRGREWKEKVYTDLVAQSIEKVDPPAAAPAEESGNEDLPF
jgi:hypothetical protein